MSDEKVRERQKIEHWLDEFHDDMFPLDVETVKSTIDSWQSKYEQYSRLFLTFNEYGLVLYGSRLETDDEYNTRIEAYEARQKKIKDREKTLAKKRKEDEYKTYLRLKEKYEKNND